MAVTLRIVAMTIFLLGVASAAIRNEYMLKNVADAGYNKETHMIMTQPIKEDMGQFTPCSAKDPKFTATWTPKDIKLGQSITLNFDMTPTVDLDKGSVDVTVWLPSYSEPIYQDTQDFTCASISKFLPKICPFKKGKEVTEHLTQTLPADLPLPPGQFTVQAKVTNDQGEEFICIHGDINVVQ